MKKTDDNFFGKNEKVNNAFELNINIEKKNSN